MHFAEQGQGEALLLLHPTGLSSHGYYRVMDHLTGFRVLAPDLPGCGLSDRLPAALAAGPSMEAFADVLAEFLDGVNLERVHVFGAHLGNKLGAALASRHPGRVASCFFSGHTHSLMLDAAVRNRSFPNHQGLLKWAGGEADASQAWNDLLNEAASLGRCPDAGDGVTPAWRLEQAYDEVVCRLLCMRAYGPLYSANFSFDFGGAVRRMACPVHVLELVVPEEASLERQAPVWARSLSDCTAQSLETDLRTLLYQHPDKLAEQVSAFLRRLRGRAESSH